MARGSRPGPARRASGPRNSGPKGARVPRAAPLNETQRFTTDPEARRYRKGHGQEARLAYLGHVLVENRPGLIVDVTTTQGDGTAEADAALRTGSRLQPRRKGKVTLAADRACARHDPVQTLRQMGVVVRVAQKRRGSALDRRRRRHAGYQLSQRCRPLVERVFAWLEWVAVPERLKLRGLAKRNWLVQFAAAAYKLWRPPKLEAQLP